MRAQGLPGSARSGGVSAHAGSSPTAGSHIPTLEHFLPPIPFFQRCVSSAAVSCPSSCSVAPAILAARLTVYPDGAGLLSCAWHVFSIYKSCAEAGRTKPNKLWESSGALQVCFGWCSACPGHSPCYSPCPRPLLHQTGGFVLLSMLSSLDRSMDLTLAQLH